MQAAGMGRGARRRVDRPRFGWDSLTEAELRVIAAVTRGLTNGEASAELFVSRHTVESHLKHVLAKLGVRSRAEVARHGGVHGL
ncbi:MAG: helix-turn-helix transcriptional regulator [Acidimicrobiales bacterium]